MQDYFLASPVTPGDLLSLLGNQEILDFAPNLYAGCLDFKGLEIFGAQLLFLELSLVISIAFNQVQTTLFLLNSECCRQHTSPRNGYLTTAVTSKISFESVFVWRTRSV